MVRKIGFDQERKPRKKSVADQYLDEFRAKARDKRQLSERLVAQKDAPVRTRSWPTILFLCVWLVAWTAAIVFVGMLILSGEGPVFLIIWEIAAVIGWFVAVFILRAQLRGTPARPDKGDSP